MANLLSIGQTALTAAQVGLSTTGHNISNANTDGYNRQVVVQSSQGGDRNSFGFVGAGTEVSVVKRVYNEFLTGQVLNSQTSQSSLSSYYTQVSQINNMFADSTAGVTPAMQEFFSAVQNLASAPPASQGAARSTLLADAQTLVGQFQDVSERLNQLRDSANGTITTSITNINSLASQIAKLNDAIATVQAGNNGKPANDLLDQRDKLVSDLSKEIKVTVSKQGDDYNISIGNGQALVVGNKTFELTPVASATDPLQLQVGYKTAGNIVTLPDTALTGGTLGGTLEFRSQTLDKVQNELGRVAIVMASEFNAQHKLGQDLNGNPGGDFFKVASPVVNLSNRNTGNAQLSASITDAGLLTASDYRFEYVGPGDYRVTRLADGVTTSSPTVPMSIDGLKFDITSGAMAAGDQFLIKPTVNGATDIGVALSNPNAIAAAAAAPVLTGNDAANTGTGRITAGVRDATYTSATVTPAITLQFDAAAGELSGFPATLPVTVTNGASSTTYAAGVPVPYTAGATISFGGLSFEINGTPADGDKFAIGANTSGVGDNRNALLLGALQTKKLVGDGSATLQNAFGQMVNMIGNKAHELDVNKTAEETLLAQTVAAQQSESGVNLDEEAANLLRYQQAYQAAGKVMQTASKLFDVVLSLGQ